MRNLKDTLKINQHKKTAFLHKRAEFLQNIYISVKSRVFLQLRSCKKQDFYIKNGFLKAVFCNMV